jgi:hypothetical protein
MGDEKNNDPSVSEQLAEFECNLSTQIIGTHCKIGVRLLFLCHNIPVSNENPRLGNL